MSKIFEAVDRMEEIRREIKDKENEIKELTNEYNELDRSIMSS